MRRPSAIGRAFLVVPIALSSFTPAAGDETAASGGPVKFSAMPAGGGPPYFTLFLPEGWRCERQGLPNAVLEKFLFSAPREPLPYVWVRVLKSGSSDNLVGNEGEAPKKRALLSGGETKQTYFDKGRGVFWKYAHTGVDTTTVDVAFPGEPEAGQSEILFTFVAKRAGFYEFEPTILTLVDNIHVHRGENVAEEAIGLSVSPGLFEGPGFFRGCRFLLVAVVVLVLGTLFRIERRISKRRQDAADADVDAAVRARKRREMLTRKQRNAADSYIRDSLGKRRSV